MDKEFVDLEKLRRRIDEIDSKLLPLFLERMDVARQVADYKRENDMPVLDRKREREVLDNKVNRLEDKSRAGEVYEFFSCVMSISRGVQTKELNSEAIRAKLEDVFVTKDKVLNPDIVYFGTEGSYSEEATIAYFGEKIKRASVKTIEDAFEYLKDEKANYAVLPIENSYTGSISDTIDFLEKYNFYITGEVNVPINHCLVSVPGAGIEDIKTIYSHEQGLLQCREFLKRLPGITQETYFNTAISAKMVSECGDVSKAAIASERTAKLYGLDILAKDINLSSKNTTRFVVISRNAELSHDADKISVAFTLPHESGTLHRVLATFAQEGLNLLKIESRPMFDRNFEYIFYVDFSGNLMESHVKRVIENVIEQALEFKILGNYKAGKRL